MAERTILIIDDSDSDRATLRRHLGRDRTQQYHFVEETLIETGLARARELRPDCVFLDHHLPDGTGLDFLAGIRDGQGTIPFPVVVLTGSGSQNSAVSLLHAGAHDYLVKADVEAEALRLALTNAMFKVRTQRELENQRRELERRNCELVAAKETAERANAVKDEFLAMLSHELRTPLTPVLSVVSAALSDPKLPADLRETYSMIRRNVQLEARLIDDLLDLTRVLNGNFEVTHQALDLAACLRAAIELAQTDFEAKRLRFEARLPAEPVVVSGDFPRLQQVFWNLLRNAARFSLENGYIELRTRVEDGQVVLEIEDEGTGIEATRISEIFNAFNRPTAGPRFGSAGVGLAIGRAVIEAHGGKLEVQSRGSGCGATFAVRLPIAARATSDEAGPPPGRVDARQATVLIVEDHEDTRRAISRGLRRRGYGVAAAGDLASAMEQFEMIKPTLVICDIGLPDGTGWELLERMHRTRKVRAIAVSGYGMDHDVERSHSVGFDAHVTKPVDFARLEAVISAVLAAPK